MPPFVLTSGKSLRLDAPGIEPVTSEFLFCMSLTWASISPNVNSPSCAFKGLVDKFSGISYKPIPSTFFAAECVVILIKSPTDKDFTKLIYLLVVPFDSV